MVPILSILTNKLTLSIAAAALAVGVVFYAYQTGYSNGKTVALAEAAEKTKEAMEELSDNAEKARFERRLCNELGGTWVFADNKCNQE